MNINMRDGVEYALADCEVSKEQSLKMAEWEYLNFVRMNMQLLEHAD